MFPQSGLDTLHRSPLSMRGILSAAFSRLKRPNSILDTARIRLTWSESRSALNLIGIEAVEFLRNPAIMRYILGVTIGERLRIPTPPVIAPA